MKIVEIEISKLKEYKNNPRHNEGAVNAVAESIKQFGFKNPIIVDKDYVIVAGHTRKLASEKLGLKKVPCVIADDLTEQQINAFRLVDNRTAELAEWDFDKLEEELSKLNDFNMIDFGFNTTDIDWAEVDDLTETSYEEPKAQYLRCPSCGCVDYAIHFVKVDNKNDVSKDNNEDIS